jgi:hypothetical protein
MFYTIKIKDKSSKAKSIINLLKALQEDYDFIEISEEKENQDDKIMNELEVRYNAYIGNPEGKEWSILMKEL